MSRLILSVYRVRVPIYYASVAILVFGVGVRPVVPWASVRLGLLVR